MKFNISFILINSFIGFQILNRLLHEYTISNRIIFIFTHTRVYEGHILND